MLASAGDGCIEWGGIILRWVYHHLGSPREGVFEMVRHFKRELLLEEEHPVVLSCLFHIRGHAMDIYDISWCPNSQFLVSSGTDSNVIIWGVDGTQYQRIHDHSGYIQGIDWSQDDATIISVANDRTARVYSYAKGHLNTSLQTENGILTQTPRDEYRISRNIVNNRPRRDACA